MRALGLSLLLAAVTTPAAAARTTVAIVPLVTSSGPEYQWIGAALASALTMRVAMQPELNAVVGRQVSAAIRSDNLEGRTLSDPAVAARLGKLLGADLVLVGSYEAQWPDIRVALKAIEPASGSVRGAYDVSGGLDELITLEARVAGALAQALGAEKPEIAPGAFGTTSLRAWRATTLAESVLDWQSLGPRAADARAELALLPAAVREAKEKLVEATKSDEEYGEAWAALGIAQALLGETKDAWRSFGKATALGAGHHPAAVAGAAFVRMREGRFDEAAKIYKSAIERRPGFLIARGYLGELYNHLGQYREALSVFQAYAEVAPRQPWVLAQRGYTKAKLGDHRGAIDDTIAAAALAPESPSLLIELASRYIDAKKLIGAEDALRQAMELFPEETRVYVRLGYVYLLQGQDELAIPISEKALVQAKSRQGSKDAAYAHLNLARAYGHKGENDKALEHVKAAKAAGLANLVEIDEDPKLDGLRKDPRYRALVN